MKILLFTLLLVLMCINAELQCFWTKGSQIFMDSEDDLLEGETLNMMCMVNHSIYTGCQPHFTFRSLISENGQLMDMDVPDEHLKLVNSTTVGLNISEVAVKNTGIYTCFCGEKALCYNYVYVGYKPQDVLNFSCISNNWENMTCTWTPQYNPITTNYTLKYEVQSSSRIPCPHPIKNGCFWNLTIENNVPMYRNTAEDYKFYITGSNIRGVHTYPYILKHFSIVKPASPTDVSPSNITEHSFTVSWMVPHPMDAFRPGLTHRLKYKSPYDSEWKVVGLFNSSQKDNASFHYNVAGLFPYTIYNLSIELKSPLATEEEFWSDPTVISVRTNLTAPASPPKVDIGSFEVESYLDSVNVYVYWKQILRHEKNGPGFGYAAKLLDNYLSSPVEVKNSYAKFERLNFHSKKFVLYSYNENGTSKQSSKLFVPAKDKLPKTPRALSTIDRNGTGNYHFAWMPPENPELELESYTLFWCNHTNPNRYRCDGFLDWVHISGHKNSFDKKLYKNVQYKFAISANYKNGLSSGMVWSSCIILSNNVLGKITEFWTESQSHTSIKLNWKLDCIDRMQILKEYQVVYCEIEHDYDSHCIAENNYAFKKFAAKDQEGNFKTSYEVTDLDPYKYYRFTIQSLSEAGIGLPSDPKTARTAEGVPGPPENLEVVNITEDSITLTWMYPVARNGIIKSFDLQLDVGDGDSHTITHEVKTDEDDGMCNSDEGKCQYEINSNIYSFTQYNISVRASTSAGHSIFSKVITATTKIGSPGEVEEFESRLVNLTHVWIGWKQPEHPGGPISKYEVWVTPSDSKQNYTVSVQGKLFGSIIEVNCSSPEQTYNFSIRAVTKTNDGVQLFGPWSKKKSILCLVQDFPVALVASLCAGAVVCILFIIVFFLYCGRKMKLKFDDIIRHKIALPPGLAIDTPTPINNGKVGHKNHDKFQSYNRMESTASDVSLIHRFPGDGTTVKERNISGDSSGCSSTHSGHPCQDSVSSAITTRTNISTDSGTEADHAPDEVFRDSLDFFHNVIPMTERSSSLPRVDEKPESDTIIEKDKESNPAYVKSDELHYSNYPRRPNYTKFSMSIPELRMLKIEPQPGMHPAPVRSSTGYITMPDSTESFGHGSSLQQKPRMPLYSKYGLQSEPDLYVPLDNKNSTNTPYFKVGPEEVMDRQQTAGKTPAGGYITMEEVQNKMNKDEGTTDKQLWADPSGIHPGTAGYVTVGHMSDPYEEPDAAPHYKQLAVVEDVAADEQDTGGGVDHLDSLPSSAGDPASRVLKYYPPPISASSPKHMPPSKSSSGYISLADSGRFTMDHFLPTEREKRDVQSAPAEVARKVSPAPTPASRAQTAHGYIPFEQVSKNVDSDTSSSPLSDCNIMVSNEDLTKAKDSVIISPEELRKPHVKVLNESTNWQNTTPQTFV